LSDPIAPMPPEINNPGPAAAGNDHTTLFGVLAIILGICFWPAGLVFSILAMRSAGKAGKPKTLGIIGLVLTIIFFIIFILSLVHRVNMNNN
jgi:hypothetical protein